MPISPQAPAAEVGGASGERFRPVHVVAGALAAAVVVALVVTLALVHATRTTPSAAADVPATSWTPSPTPATTTVYGTLELEDYETASNDCVGEGGYSDIEPGATVILTDENGTILGSTALGVGSGDSSSTCTFPFTIDDVPESATQYAVEVSHRGKVVNSRQELESNSWRFELTLGS